MNKIITQKEIDVILKAFYDLNAPIKLFDGVKDMFEKLPEEKKEEGVDKNE